jgi:hypothetical protein
MKMKCSFLIGLIAVAGMVGCGAEDGDFPDTAPVSGQITLNGTPQPMALVTFHPTDTDGSPASARTDARGNYVLASFSAEDGAVPGSYLVTVTKMSESKQGQAVGSEEDPDAAYLELEQAGVDVTGGEGGDAGSGLGEAQNLLPAKYQSRESTDLKADVPKEGGDAFNFELTG